ncbi:MAG: dihydrolipoyl dehydrogenase [Leptospiraceae bacterium]|nr:dihydrolipoyl dehydrogenase [Leptospiraceae bacterium]
MENKTEQKFDYTVIGSGPGGYVSAIRAAQLGLKAAIIEKAELGGVCLNWGCIPTKALLHCAHSFKNIQTLPGVELPSEIRVKIDEMVKHSRQTAEKLSRGVASLLKKYKVTVLTGHAEFIKPDTLKVVNSQDNSQIEILSKYIVIATGARAREFENMKFSKNIWSSREAMVPDATPKTLLVIGGGAIGLEFADFYACLGSKVTLLEAAEHILPADEQATSSALKKALTKTGVEIIEQCKVTGLTDDGKSVNVVYTYKDQSTEKKFDKALLAVGTTANTENLGLDILGINLEGGRIPTDELCRVKNQKKIFAIGDVTPGKQLAHKASYEGLVAAETAAGNRVRPLENHLVPACIYTSPQVASIGYTKTELEAKKIPFDVGEFPFLASGKALAMQHGDGSARVYIHKETGELLGAHFVGPEVTELISSFGIGMSSELTWHEMHETIFAHPTLSEAVHEAISVAKKVSCNY